MNERLELWPLAITNDSDLVEFLGTRGADERHVVHVFEFDAQLFEHGFSGGHVRPTARPLSALNHLVSRHGLT
ncbi:hypothetical protein XFEB_02064 [Xylella fastidiosa EB92.1]|nr:hypothetical protein XFEB_02064 [Xylella fastidiosa EB92.1]